MTETKSPDSGTTSEPGPTSPFSWASSPNGTGVALRPWLTDRELTIVQQAFETRLSFGRADHPDLGTATTISPRIGEADRPLVEAALLDLWATEGTSPTLRPRHRPKPAGSPSSSPAPTGTSIVSSGVIHRNSPSSGRETPRERPRPPAPEIVFSPSAFFKYMFMCHAHGSYTEVGGYGVHLPVGANNVIYIAEFVTVRQHVTPAFCSLDPGHANELVVERCMREEDFNPNQLLACWCHTHPGFSVTPSGVDWATFAGHDSAAWAAMIILDREGRIGAHVRQKGALRDTISEVKARVDWAALPRVAGEIDAEAWEEEYLANIWPSAKDYHPDHRRARPGPVRGQSSFWDDREDDRLIAGTRQTYGRIDAGPPGGGDHDDDAGPGPGLESIDWDRLFRDPDAGPLRVQAGQGGLPDLPPGTETDERDDDIQAVEEAIETAEEELAQHQAALDETLDELDRLRGLRRNTGRALITYGAAGEPAPLLKGMADDDPDGADGRAVSPGRLVASEYPAG